MPTPSPSDGLTTAELAAVAQLGIDPDQLRASLAPKAKGAGGVRVPRTSFARAAVAVTAVLMVIIGFRLATDMTHLAALHRRVESAREVATYVQAYRDRAASAVEAAPFDVENALRLAQSERYLTAAHAKLEEATADYEEAVARPFGRILASSRGLPTGR